MTPEEEVERLSSLFRGAVRGGDATEALRIGRLILSACHQIENQRRWWKIDQRGAHYRSIAETVSLTLQGIGVGNLHEDQTCAPGETKVEALEEGRMGEGRTEKVQELRQVQRDLGLVSRLAEEVGELVLRAEPLVTALRGRIDGVNSDIDHGQDALLHYYVDRAAARGCVPPGHLLCFIIFLAGAFVLWTLTG